MRFYEDLGLLNPINPLVALYNSLYTTLGGCYVMCPWRISAAMQVREMTPEDTRTSNSSHQGDI